jgi:hypothetical protein
VTAPLSDDFPVLLGPVRVETRFTATELLVRMFPDEWQIEKFEPKPTAAEVSALDAYWTALWRGGDDAVAERAAFAELTTRIPAGRATWLLQNRVPANLADRPSGVPAGTTVLVVLTTTAVAANDRAPSVTYWTAVWRAHGDLEAIRTADRALLTAVGNTRATTIRRRRPVGVDASLTELSDAVQVAFLVLPTPAAADLATQSWTQAARARLLPDRFTVLGFLGGQQVISVTGAAIPDTLAVSPDPTGQQFSVNEQTGALTVPDQLKWLTDFTRAVQVGMGVRIPLTDQIRGGVDRLVVLGLRRKSAPAQAAVELADLVTKQVRSPNGFSVLPQGTTTNNAEQADAGPDPAAQADAALRAATFTSAAAPADWAAKSDGQWLAELLGIDPVALTGAPNADRTDIRDARAANTALWPATWGYYLQAVLHPAIGAATVDATRAYFTGHVSGRGPVPTVQIGRQPYGILPTTAFSRLAWPDTHPAAGHRRGLHQLLTKITEDWRVASEKVSRLGGDGAGSGDPHQVLLDILALHPTSAEFHQRYARSVEDIYNREQLGGVGPTVVSALETLQMPQPIRALLTRLGMPAALEPGVVRRLFVGAQFPLLAPLVDDVPLSETDAIRDYTTDERNYLRWLADLAATDLDAIRLEVGFAGDRPPAALLYMLLRHAVLLGWADAAAALAAAAGSPVAPPSPADELFIHIRQSAAGSESRFRQLYSPDPAVTGNPNTLVVDHLPSTLDGRPATRPLAEQIQALGLLADLPTARLERVLVEHLDCATYRLDAWRLGLANERLTELRYGAEGTPPRRGVHLGAYGWLDDVRPRTDTLTPVPLTGDLAQLFTPPGSAPLLHDPENAGYVHAPSPAQATTAAVLRAGYLANATPANPGTFAVNLSSDRVREALSILDGLRQGQSLGALLGYRFERGLHDRWAEAELDSLITALRGAFPLRAGRLTETEPPPDTPVEVVEARNVIDGLELVRRVTRTADTTYPFGADGLPADPSEAQLTAIGAEVDRLLALHDALADLAVAESTHQTLAGNTERAAATLDAYAKEGFPPDPAVIRTPRSGITLTHRLGLQFDAGVSPPGLNRTPRAQAEPAVNDWLPGLLPDRDDVGVVVRWTDPDGDDRSRVVTQEDVDLAPIDLLWAVRPAGEAAATDLDDRIIGVVVDRDHPRPDVPLTIHYTERITDKVSFFELSPLIAALRTLITTARPLRPSDLVPAAGPATVDRAADDAVTVRRNRPEAVRESLDDLAEDIEDLLADLAPLYPAPPAEQTEEQLDDIVDGIDSFLTRYADLVTVAGGFGMLRSGWGELTAWRRGVFTGVLAAVAATAERMGQSLAAANALLTQYEALPGNTPNEVRFSLLQRAERLLTTTPTSPRPSQPSALRAIVLNRRNAFDNRLDDLQDVADTNRNTLSGLLDEVESLLPLTQFDATGLDLTPFRDRVVVFGRDLLDRTVTLQKEVTTRFETAGAALADYDLAVTGPDRVTAATAALTAMIGEDVLVVPEFTPSDALHDELREARRDSDDLVEHLVDAGRDFPVDDWLHGVARVREAPRLWERVVLLSDALRARGVGDLFDQDDPALAPIQLPYRENDHWLGMEFAQGTSITEDRLLYTAHYASDPPLLGGGNQVGLLLDEWTEVIPAVRETTGIAADLDRPDSEPPQAMLLVVPPVKTGAWQPDDLVAAITDTFELARLRAVEPSHLDDTAYAQLLPATVLSATRRPITISTDLAVANLRWRARD